MRTFRTRTVAGAAALSLALLGCNGDDTETNGVDDTQQEADLDDLIDEEGDAPDDETHDLGDGDDEGDDTEGDAGDEG